ncbi:uncharacterized protein LOC131529798 isoform X2 [Onychostoma macrolepis]|uniref:uncharacterized protein LOC131529798 isoform X2 n=1 Tax=Onychostoma macrolepis TaxID=369639 RepID=UPI002729FED1|nr:uncharacterized protein LOC131529798 isoform X2 [Onychostoma macrolepis]
MAAVLIGGYSLKNNFIVSLLTVFAFFVHGASDVGTDRVSVFVMKGDSATLHTNITIKQQDRVKWYFTDSLIARLNLSYICTDVQCNKGTERFRDRLKLDHQSGDLTIMNINTSDAGTYHLKIVSSNSRITRVFEVGVHDVPTAEIKRKTVKEGESVPLDTPEVKNPDNVMTWYFNDTLIAEITGDQSEICRDDQCRERFRDRLKVDQTGSLTITNTRTTDSGDYKLLIKSSRNHYSTTSIKSFSVSVTDSGLSPGTVAGIYVAVAVAVVLLVAAAVGVMIYRRRSSRKGKYHLQMEALVIRVDPNTGPAPMGGIRGPCPSNELLCPLFPISRRK